jgi:hypothetical protein
MIKLKLIHTIFCLFLLTKFINAQQSLNTGGGDANGSGGSVSFSIGQVVYTTNSSNAGSLAQGVQHAYEIFAVSTSEPIASLNCLVYPNPTSGNLTLEIKEDIESTIRFQIFDIHGKLLFDGPVVSRLTSLSLSAVPSATYLLRVGNEDQQQVKTFKIIKNK